MTTTFIVMAVVTTMVFLFCVVILVGRSLSRSSAPTLSRPCYRCGVVATNDYMGLHYCAICCIVVVRMLPSVRNDPPYGFPGSSGYLEFPEVEEKKKES